MVRSGDEEISMVGTGMSKPVRRGRWSSFVADPLAEPPRILHEARNPVHRLRVEHDDQTLLIHLSDEDGSGWTVFAVDRGSRRWAVAQAQRQIEAAERAYSELHRST